MFSRPRLVVVLAISVAVAVSGCGRTATGDSEARDTVTVFAASSLAGSFERIETAFQAEYPDVDVVITSAGTNTLAAQIDQGAPAEVFASADESTIRDLADEGLVATPQLFAHNRMEIAVEDGNPYDIDGIESLVRPEIRVALCAPQVPCGAYTAQVLQNSGVELRAASQETSVSAVVAKVRLGEVDAGIVYHTDVVATAEVDGVEINTFANVTTAYLIAPVTNDDRPTNKNAESFIEFVLSDQGQQILIDAGFAEP